jgi:hypothetical protein
MPVASIFGHHCNSHDSPQHPYKTPTPASNAPAYDFPTSNVHFLKGQTLRTADNASAVFDVRGVMALRKHVRLVYKGLAPGVRYLPCRAFCVGARQCDSANNFTGLTFNVPACDWFPGAAVRVPKFPCAGAEAGVVVRNGGSGGLLFLGADGNGAVVVVD